MKSSLTQTIDSIIKSVPRNQIDDVYELLVKSTKVKKAHLLANPTLELSNSQFSTFEKLYSRYNQDEPLAYLLGYKYFYDSKFKVNKHTLIPRPETEMLVDNALEAIANVKNKQLNILEIGIGSGCVSISIMKEFQKHQSNHPTLNILGTDISKEAIKVAKDNTKSIIPNLGKNRLKLMKADILPNKIDTKFDLIISNPPYISQKEYKRLDKSVKDYEPKTALTAGEKGLKIYRKILEDTKNNSKKGTIYIFEISPTICANLVQLLGKILPKSKVEILRDQFERERFIKFVK